MTPPVSNQALILSTILENEAEAHITQSTDHELLEETIKKIAQFILQTEPLQEPTEYVVQSLLLNPFCLRSVKLAIELIKINPRRIHVLPDDRMTGPQETNILIISTRAFEILKKYVKSASTSLCVV